MQAVFMAAEQAVAVPLDTVAIATLVSFFIPLVVSFVTKRTASNGLKSVVNIAGTAFVAVVALWTIPLPEGVTMSWTLIVNTFLAAIMSSVVGYKGLWKPTGISTSIEVKTENFGLGSPPAPEMQTEEGQIEEALEGGS